ncbi:iron ABC transporter permease [Microbacterium suaedae]|uniref:iron ABC transporter permease n=1 Tax=Microbacterium suaedae TaxID=2067813 RepID=UPI001E4D18D5|nr:iron ABC transporter permease [Microbacterium suaedae]
MTGDTTTAPPRTEPSHGVQRRGRGLPTVAVAGEAPAVPRGWSAATMIGAAVLLAVWLLVAVAWHLTQGTADLDLASLWAIVTGEGTSQGAAVIAESRVPRLLAALVVGSALGASGATMQAVARNPLASPDTTAVNAGAHLAVTIAAVLGATLSPFAGVGVAFIGGLAGAAVVIALSSGRDASPIRLVLAGSAITLGVSSITSALLLVFPWRTQNLFAWGAGSLAQNGSQTVLSLAPIVIAGIAAIIVFGRRLDLLQLGDDAARSLGVNVGATRVTFIVLSVLLAATAVALTGPIGFIGLCAPVLMRVLARWVRPMRRHRVLVAMSAVAGIALVLTADVVLRAVVPGGSQVTIPTGVVTALIGAIFLIALAQTVRTGVSSEAIAAMRAGTRLGRRAPGLIIAASGVMLAAVAVAGALLGDSPLLLGDVGNWLKGVASVHVQIVLETRIPRVFAAVLAGACLAVAGCLVQTVTRNPLADPGVLGISGAAGLGAVAVIVTAPEVGFVQTLLGALAGAGVGALIVFVLGSGRGAGPARTVLVGVGTGAGAGALTTLLIVRTDPFNQTMAITWLGGSTYGAFLEHQLPMVAALALAGIVLSRTSRDLDLVQFDDTTPRTLGIDLGRTQVLHIAIAVVLTAVATASVGVISFVGLVAPHAARLMIGKRHATVLPLAAVLGAVLVGVADLIGRTVIAPAQLPAGLVTAVIGTPYFVWLLWRMRTRR